MAEATSENAVFFVTIILILIRVSLQDFICPFMCQCEEYILTTNCANTQNFRPDIFYNVSRLTSVLLLEQNELVNVSHILPWKNLANARKLSLASNSIGTFEGGTLSLMRGLLYIDVSHNSLYSVPSELRALTRVKYLDLSYNFIDYVGTNDFVNLGDLRTLKLTNSLKFIAPGAFRSFLYIETLVLSGSNFSPMSKCLELDSWFGYNNESSTLKEVYLSDTNICISEDTFSGFHNLKTVDISSNSITVLPRTLLSGLVKLQKFFLRENSIPKIPVDFFADTKALHFLDIATNNISSAENINVKPLRKLKVLNLEVNYLSEPPPLDFRLLRNLRELHLKKNNIRVFPLVNNLRKLEILDLSRNHIGEVTINALSDCKSLREVYLDKNYGLKLFELSTTNLDSMDYFSMKDNSIYCDCNLLQYYKYLELRYEHLPKWLAILFQTETCKMPIFEDNNWYNSAKYLNQYMICSHYTPPETIAILVGSWMTIIVGTVFYIWLKSACSVRKDWKAETLASAGSKRGTRKRVTWGSPGLVEERYTGAKAQSQPVWEEKEKLLPSSGGGDIKGSRNGRDTERSHQPAVEVVIVNFKDHIDLDDDI